MHRCIKILFVSFLGLSLAFCGCSSPTEPEDHVLKDIDGNVYKTVKIGDPEWMTENLKVTHYRKGDEIPNITDDSVWSGLSTRAYCVYDNNESNADVYGYLYNWYAVDDSRGLAPEGWHVPTDDDWKELEMYLGMRQEEVDDMFDRGTDEGDKLKEAGNANWESFNTGTTNESGFTALPGGSRSHNNTYARLGSFTYFWSSSEYNSNSAWDSNLRATRSGINRLTFNKKDGFSVRCVRDK